MLYLRIAPTPDEAVGFYRISPFDPAAVEESFHLGRLDGAELLVSL